jgi:DNA-binding transcriptional MocR family regulator
MSVMVPDDWLTNRGPIAYGWPVVSQTNRRVTRRERSFVDPASPDLVAMLDGWSSRGHGSLPRRLAHAIRHLIDAGVLPSGWRLPPERTLARLLAVSRTTVTQALDELRDEGRLQSTQGSGTYVAGPATDVPFGTRIAEHLLSGPGIDLAKGDAPDLSHLPPVAIEIWQLNATCGGAAVNSAGLPAMRQAIAELYARGGTTGRPRITEADQIHVTAGSHQASHLLVSTLARRGEAVAVAEYSYPGIFDIFDSCEVRAVPVRLDRAGMIPESLDDVLTREGPAALYLQAGPQIPTGRVTTLSRTRALAGILDRHRVPVIEDTTVAPLAFAGTAPMLADHCRVATIVSTGSLSKTCWAGLRLGWIRGPVPVIEQSIYRHLGWDLGPSVPSQLLALQLLPHLDRIADERRRRLEIAVDAALDQLLEAIPDASILRPDGGSVLWARFPVDDSAVLVNLARRHSVRIAPGSIHAAGKVPGPFVRIDVDRPGGVVREGIERLARAWRDHRDYTAAV